MGHTCMLVAVPRAFARLAKGAGTPARAPTGRSLEPCRHGPVAQQSAARTGRRCRDGPTQPHPKRCSVSLRAIAPAEVKRFVVFDVHKNSLVAGVVPA
jgi:hypothetical protein